MFAAALAAAVTLLLAAEYRGWRAGVWLAKPLASTIFVVAAAGASGADARIWVGAGLFYLSDLCVARDRFVAPGFANGRVGLPLYYAAQLVLAHSVGVSSAA